MRVVAIAAVARNGVIGAAGAIPWHLPEDFAHFKRTTLGHTLLMGRTTYDSIGRPLPGRTTIVLTRDPAWTGPDGVLVAHGVDDALALAREQSGDLFVAGGAVVYAALADHLDEQLISEVHLAPAGDTTYPIDPRDPALASLWREISRDPHPGFDVVRWVRDPGAG